MFHVVRRYRLALLFFIGLLVNPSYARAVDLKILPSSSASLFTLNVRQILSAPLFQTDEVKPYFELVKSAAEGFLEKNETAQAYLTPTGFDVFRDLHKVTMVSSPGKDPTKNLVIIEGRFDTAKIDALARQSAKDGLVKIDRLGTYFIYQMPLPKGEESLYACFPDEATLYISGKRDIIADAIARANGTMHSVLSKEFKALFDNITPKQSLAYIATQDMFKADIDAAENTVDGAPPTGMKAQVAMWLSKGEGALISLTINSDITLQVGIGAKTAAGAKEITSQIQTGLTMAKTLVNLQVQNNDKLAPVTEILKTLMVHADDRNVMIEGTASAEHIIELLNIVPLPNLNP